MSEYFKPLEWMFSYDGKIHHIHFPMSCENIYSKIWNKEFAVYKWEITRIWVTEWLTDFLNAISLQEIERLHNLSMCDLCFVGMTKK